MLYFDLLVFLFFFSCEIVFQNQIQLVGTNYGGMVAFRMAEMYPNFVKKVVISNSGVGFMSISLDELFTKSNLSSISEVMSRE
jgi:pimeloyl-ACP methyl ester carboxylesterase